MRPVLLALCVSIALLAASSAEAQGDARAEARVHFSRGLELFDEGRMVEALAEFEEAYRISPAPALLYNLAQIHAELGHAVEAADAYQRFLSEAEDIDPELRADAERALRSQRARIGRVRVEVTVSGARIFLDDVEVGASPLPDALPVSAGEHVVVAQIAGFETQRHRFRVAGGATYDARIELVPSGSRGASLRIESRVPGVEIRVDGASMGLTPLDATVPVSGGAHRVEGVRDGYVPFALEVTAVDGSETRVVVQTSPDGSAPSSTRAPLRIALPATSSTVRIDGDAVAPVDGLEVPVGLHDVEIRVAEREPIDVRIDVLPDEGFALSPAYAWTPDARASRVDTASAQRTAGIALLAIGGPLLVASLAVVIWDVTTILPDLEARAAIQASCVMSMATCASMRAEAGYPTTDVAFEEEFAGVQSTYYGVLGTGVAVLALSGVATVVGIALLGAAPSEDDIDRGARSDVRLELDLGPGGLGLHGTF